MSLSLISFSRSSNNKGHVWDRFDYVPGAGSQAQNASIPHRKDCPHNLRQCAPYFLQERLINLVGSVSVCLYGDTFS